MVPNFSWPRVYCFFGELFLLLMVRRLSVSYQTIFNSLKTFFCDNRRIPALRLSNPPLILFHLYNITQLCTTCDINMTSIQFLFKFHRKLAPSRTQNILYSQSKLAFIEFQSVFLHQSKKKIAQVETQKEGNFFYSQKTALIETPRKNEKVEESSIECSVVCYVHILLLKCQYL